MSQTFDFYDQRARAAEAEAERSTLANVRERELRSARAWREMADRQSKIDSERVKADAERAERRAAESEAFGTADTNRHPETLG
jgi:hypothetical protein